MCSVQVLRRLQPEQRPLQVFCKHCVGVKWLLLLLLRCLPCRALAAATMTTGGGLTASATGSATWSKRCVGLPGSAAHGDGAACCWRCRAALALPQRCQLPCCLVLPELLRGKSVSVLASTPRHTRAHAHTHTHAETRSACAFARVSLALASPDPALLGPDSHAPDAAMWCHTARAGWRPSLPGHAQGDRGGAAVLWLRQPARRPPGG